MSKKLWGGRFTKKIDKDFFEFQKSIGFDYKLAKFDIIHSLIHVKALCRAGILSSREASSLIKAISDVDKDISAEVKNGKFKPTQSEDVHTEIQNRVEEKVKGLALKLHTLRSRNDQVAFDEKFYCVYIVTSVGRNAISLMETMLKQVEMQKKQKFIGYTHTQRAQIIHFSDYLLAYYNMFKRDNDRLRSYASRLKISIGAGALTGTSLTRAEYSQAIIKSNFSDSNKIEVVSDAIGNVSDRDFIIELLSILSLIQMHLSRLAEDFILYSTREFNLIKIPEEFCTGSSLMPHKKNADFLELVRGNTGKIYGNLVSMLTTMKGLPLSYNRDMQCDKEPLFSSVELVTDELRLMNKFVSKIKIDKDRVNEILTTDISLYATEIAEWLVRKSKAKVPFKVAHDITGKLVIMIEKNGGVVEDISEVELKKLHPELSRKVIKKVMNADYAISAKKTMNKDRNLRQMLKRLSKNITE